MLNVITNSSFLIFLLYRGAIIRIYRRDLVRAEKRFVRPLQIFSIFVAIIIIPTIIFFAYDLVVAKNLLLIFYFIVGIFPFLLIYLFSQAGVYEIYFRIRRNILYHSLKIAFNLVLIAFFILAIYFLSLLSIRFPNLHFTGTRIEVIKWPLPLDKNITYEKALVALATISVIFLLWIFKRRIEYILKEKFYQSEINYRKTANELSEIIVRNLQLSELAKNVLKEIEKLKYLKSASLVIFQNESKVCCSEFFGFNRANLAQINKLFTNELMNFLKNQKGKFRLRR